MTEINKISKQIEDYIDFKHSLGYEIKVESNELRRFAKYTQDINYNGSLTIDLALTWVSLNRGYSRWYRARRLEMIHTFAKYASSVDPSAQVPQTGIFGKCHGRVTPYIFTEEEIIKLMKHSAYLYSPDGIRRITVATALGLLWSTGIRISELTNLKVNDVRFNKRYLFVRDTKFHKNRLVPLHYTVIDNLEKYDSQIRLKIPDRSNEDYFFVNMSGRRFNTRSLEYAFQKLRPCLGSIPNRRQPRLYDIRHTFACRTIIRWLNSGDDVNHKIYLLSVYMGHVKPSDTYWYLSSTPELLSLAGEKFESSYGKGLQLYE